MPEHRESWEIKAQKCRDILSASLKQEWLLPHDKLPSPDELDVSGFIKKSNALSDDELKITESSATELITRMRTGELTALATVTAFLKRAHIGHQLLNFATEFLTQEALARAAELDKIFLSTGKLVGPLHGLPISLKEHIGLKDRITNATYVALIDNITTDDALLVRLLKTAGAIPIVRTNGPQSLMHVDCHNPIYGATLNPYHRRLTPGGSSGGEGASIGFRCAVMGVGTDIGGSVRVPAGFCGVYGLRTTALRNPYKGVVLPGQGQESIRCVISPLANSIEDINLFQSAVLDQEPWEEETSLTPLPWRTVGPYKPQDIRVGIMWDDGLTRPHPPVRRALQHAAGRLQEAGVDVVDWEPYAHDLGMDMITDLYFPDAAQTQLELLHAGGEPIEPLTTNSFSWARPEAITVRENWDLNVRRDTYREEYHRLMKERGVDFILCPVNVGVATELGKGRNIPYTAIWNILDQPAVSIPTGLKLDPEIDMVEPDYTCRSAAEEYEYKRYVPELFANAPIGLQVVGKHYRDEETVMAAALIASLVQVQSD
ncbi:hypothetical protein LTR84_006873 [Exophiala bonariae]|uniref:amidase n=1 Tax=Exophiala bonariae TaxID=1690606 RepID=A0AAV9N051_9EURO|nr:hypothetical protein LTR84_006873 [Exophiala bonariae]